MPTVYQSSHTGSNIDIAITKTLGCQGLPSVSNSDSGKMLQVVNGLWSAVQPESNLTMTSVLNTVYPVGAIYLSVNSTSPATLFGGTWEQIKGSFLYGCEDSGIVAGDTGGQKSVSYTPEGSNSGGAVSSHTLTTTEIPAHAHGLNSHTHTGPSHYHGLNGHTHSYDKSPTSTGTNNNDTTSTTINFSNGAVLLDDSGNFIIKKSKESIGTWTSTAKLGITSVAAAYVNSTWGIQLTGSQSHSHKMNSHSHSITLGSGTTGGNSGNTGNSGTGNTGPATGDTANAGGGGGHDHGFTNPTFSGTAATIATMPPYLAVYIWKRTA